MFYVFLGLRDQRSAWHSSGVSPTFNNGTDQIIQVSMATEFLASSSGSLISSRGSLSSALSITRGRAFIDSLKAAPESSRHLGVLTDGCLLFFLEFLTDQLRNWAPLRFKAL